jgi:Recombination endonuclease VII
VDHLTPDFSASKRCPDCGEIKSLSAFTLSKKNRDGRGTYCRPCFNKRSRAHREKVATSEGRTIRRRREVPAGQKYCPRCESVQPEGCFGKNRASRDGLTAYCRPCHNAVTRRNVERLHGNTRDYHLRRRYGITSADVDAMVEGQGGTCAVCDGKPEHVDHDHATGKVRGILCFNCNQALGNARDDVVVLQGLIDYLHRHRRSRLGLVHEASAIEGLFFEVVTRHRSA